MTTPDSLGGMMAGKWHIEIDLNSRDRNGNVVARLHFPQIGDAVFAYQPEDGSEFDAEIVGIAPDVSLVYLKVDWESMRDLGGGDAQVPADDPTGGGPVGLQQA